MLKYRENGGISFLSISALGRIREAMELLIKDCKIKWQGNLKDTYDKYLHPDVLDIESKEMFKMRSEEHTSELQSH